MPHTQTQEPGPSRWVTPRLAHNPVSRETCQPQPSSAHPWCLQLVGRWHLSSPGWTQPAEAVTSGSGLRPGFKLIPLLSSCMTLACHSSLSQFLTHDMEARISPG